MIEKDILYTVYGYGIFPMADSEREDAEIHWLCPEHRAVLIPKDFHVPRRLRRTLRHSGFTVRWNDDFETVMRACGSGRSSTWINEPLIRAYTGLAVEGKAFCLSVFQGKERVGGIYGVQIGAVCTAESMFSTVTNASSAALVVLMEGMMRAGIEMVDIQMPNDHTRQFKPLVIPHEAYMAALHRWQDRRVVLDREDFYLAAGVVLSTQSLSQTS